MRLLDLDTAYLFARQVGQTHKKWRPLYDARPDLAEAIKSAILDCTESQSEIGYNTVDRGTVEFGGNVYHYRRQ